MAPSARSTKRPRLSGSSFWKLTITAGIGIGICVIAFAIEIARAVNGNGLSWIYVIEWPILGTFGTYLWWKLLHDQAGQATKIDRLNERNQLNAASIRSTDGLPVSTEDPVN